MVHSYINYKVLVLKAIIFFFVFIIIYAGLIELIISYINTNTFKKNIFLIGIKNNAWNVLFLILFVLMPLDAIYEMLFVFVYRSGIGFLVYILAPLFSLMESIVFLFFLFIFTENSKGYRKKWDKDLIRENGLYEIFSWFLFLYRDLLKKSFVLAREKSFNKIVALILFTGVGYEIIYFYIDNILCLF